MKTIVDIMRMILSGLMPKTSTGTDMEVLAYHMAYNWLC